MQNGQIPAVRLDAEVSSRPRRRMFTADYKKRILAEIDTAVPGQTGAILRREGIYSSTLANWRKERDPLTAANEKLRRQNERLKEELRKAEIIIDVQKTWLRQPTAARSPQREVLMKAVGDLAPLIGVKRACRMLAVPRATPYRRRKQRVPSFLRREAARTGCPPPSASPCFPASTANVSRMPHPGKSTPPC